MLYCLQRGFHPAGYYELLKFDNNTLLFIAILDSLVQVIHSSHHQVAILIDCISLHASPTTGMASPTSILSLPNEILIQIIPYLGSIGDLYSLSLVNKRLYSISDGSGHVKLPASLPEYLGHRLVPPHPLLLLVGTIDQVLAWASRSDRKKAKFWKALRHGPSGLLKLSGRVAKISMMNLRGISLDNIEPARYSVLFQPGNSHIDGKPGQNSSQAALITTRQCPAFMEPHLEKWRETSQGRMHLNGASKPGTLNVALYGEVAILKYHLYCRQHSGAVFKDRDLSNNCYTKKNLFVVQFSQNSQFIQGSHLGAEHFARSKDLTHVIGPDFELELISKNPAWAYYAACKRFWQRFWRLSDQDLEGWENAPKAIVEGQEPVPKELRLLYNFFWGTVGMGRVGLPIFEENSFENETFATIARRVKDIPDLAFDIVELYPCYLERGRERKFINEILGSSFFNDT